MLVLWFASLFFQCSCFLFLKLLLWLLVIVRLFHLIENGTTTMRTSDKIDKRRTTAMPWQVCTEGEEGKKSGLYTCLAHIRNLYDYDDDDDDDDVNIKNFLLVYFVLSFASSTSLVLSITPNASASLHVWYSVRYMLWVSAYLYIAYIHILSGLAECLSKRKRAYISLVFCCCSSFATHSLARSIYFSLQINGIESQP